LTEREWREASDMRRSTVLLGVVLAIAAGLRFWRLGAGVPFAVGVDEPEIVTRAIQMMRSGDYNPRFFDYPSLYIYVQLLTAVVWFLVGAIEGKWTTLTQASVWDFLVWGRAVTAALGTATVFFVYQIGMRWGTRYALLAAGIMAVMPMHVRESHFALTDVPLTFFATLACALSLRAHEQPRAAAFGWAGAAAGLAAATKYPGALAIVLPLLAVWMTPAARPSRLRAALLTLGAATVAFLIAAPYTVLDLPGFLNGFAHLAGQYTASVRPESGWLTYIKHLRINLGTPALLLVIAGMILAVVRSVRGPGRVRWLLMLVFPLLYFWFISRQTGILFARYILPIVPFLCVLAATAVVSGVSLLRRFSIPRAVRTALIVALTAAALVPPAILAVRFDRDFGNQQTKEQAYKWIVANVPKRAKVYTEAHGLILPEHTGTNELHKLTLKTYEQYAEEGVDYLIASSQMYGTSFREPQNHPQEYAAYRTLFDQAREVAVFTPEDPLRAPEIRIFRIKP
jgi:4-amino-4-deoxy-L-arabinose transferase-like glycosyltransferase